MTHAELENTRAIDALKIDRSVITTASLHDESDEKAYWLSRTPEERLEALELYRQIAYGYDPNTLRFQRVLEVAEFPVR